MTNELNSVLALVEQFKRDLGAPTVQAELRRITDLIRRANEDLVRAAHSPEFQRLLHALGFARHHTGFRRGRRPRF